MYHVVELFIGRNKMINLDLLDTINSSIRELFGFNGSHCHVRTSDLAANLVSAEMITEQLVELNQTMKDIRDLLHKAVHKPTTILRA
jgi:hypothetical protein